MARTPRMVVIEEMLADDPTDPFLRYGLAMEYSSQGDDDAAVQEFAHLIAQNRAAPYIPAFLMCGQALARLGRLEEAANVLRRGIAAATAAGTPEALHAKGEMQGLLSTVE